ncbi:hypothetical protein [Streptomyces sp. NPDC050856]
MACGEQPGRLGRLLATTGMGTSLSAYASVEAALVARRGNRTTA